MCAILGSSRRKLLPKESPTTTWSTPDMTEPIHLFVQFMNNSNISPPNENSQPNFEDFHVYRKPSPTNWECYKDYYADLDDNDKRYFELPPNELTALAAEIAALPSNSSVNSFLDERGLVLYTNQFSSDQAAIPLHENLSFGKRFISPILFKPVENEIRQFFNEKLELPAPGSEEKSPESVHSVMQDVTELPQPNDIPNVSPPPFIEAILFGERQESFAEPVLSFGTGLASPDAKSPVASPVSTSNAQFRDVTQPHYGGNEQALYIAPNQIPSLQATPSCRSLEQGVPHRSVSNYAGSTTRIPSVGILPSPMLEDGRGTAPSAQSKKPDGAQLANLIRPVLPCFVVDNELYTYRESCYVPTDVDMLARMIKQILRNNGVREVSMAVLRECHQQLKTDPDLLRNASDLNKEVLSFRNGILHLPTCRFSQPDASYLTTFTLRCNYLTGPCSSPCFDAFLQDITCGDPILMQRIWQILGYIFSTDTSAKALFVFQGVPDSGKSVLCKLILRVFDEEQQTSLNVHELGDKFAAGNLKDKRICISGDMPSKTLSDKAISLLKQFSGDDLITADVKYSRHAKFFCRANIVLVSNHPIKPVGKDPAFDRRLIAVPFVRSTPAEKRDPHLLTRLSAELDAIVTRAINTYFILRADHYRFAGDYPINGFLANMGAYIMNDEPDTDSYITAFIRNNYIADPVGTVYTEEALTLFKQIYSLSDSSIDRAFFVNFSDMVCQMFQAKKTRKRKMGEKNPQACIEGISLKKN